MSIENFNKHKIAQTLPENEQGHTARTFLLPEWKLERLEATKRIFDLAFLGRSRACQIAANLIFSINNGLPFRLSDLVYFDSNNLRYARILLRSIEAHHTNVIDWLDEGGYLGHEAYWAVRDEWVELFDSLRNASAKMRECDG